MNHSGDIIVRQILSVQRQINQLNAQTGSIEALCTMLVIFPLGPHQRYFDVRTVDNWVNYANIAMRLSEKKY